MEGEAVGGLGRLEKGLTGARVRGRRFGKTSEDLIRYGAWIEV